MKVKASDKFSFPVSIDMTKLVSGVEVSNIDLEGDSPAELEYELAAILIHKGPSASHGHYGRVQAQNMSAFVPVVHPSHLVRILVSCCTETQQLSTCIF